MGEIRSNQVRVTEILKQLDGEYSGCEMGINQIKDKKTFLMLAKLGAEIKAADIEAKLAEIDKEEEKITSDS